MTSDVLDNGHQFTAIAGSLYGCGLCGEFQHVAPDSLAIASDGAVYVEGRGFIEGYAGQQMIASAPDLLEALSELLEVFGPEMEAAIGDSEYSRDTLQQARDAIRKATADA
jgi:hypothetical protein